VCDSTCIIIENKKSSKPVSRILFPGRNRDICHLSVRSTPQHQAGNLQALMYMILQLVRQTARNVTITTGGLLHHLLNLARRCSGEGEPFAGVDGRLFSSLLLYPHGYLPHGSTMPYAVRTFLTGTNKLARHDRPVYCFILSLKFLVAGCWIQISDF
jgi:hypothetical protein